MNVRTNVRTQVFFAYVRTLRTSDIGQRTLDNGQRTSLKNGENENRVCPIAAIAAHWTDKNVGVENGMNGTAGVEHNGAVSKKNNSIT